MELKNKSIHLYTDMANEVITIRPPKSDRAYIRKLKKLFKTSGDKNMNVFVWKMIKEKLN